VITNQFLIYGPRSVLLYYSRKLSCEDLIGAFLFDVTFQFFTSVHENRACHPRVSLTVPLEDAQEHFQSSRRPFSRETHPQTPFRRWFEEFSGGKWWLSCCPTMNFKSKSCLELSRVEKITPREDQIAVSSRRSRKTSLPLRYQASWVCLCKVKRHLILCYKAEVVTNLTRDLSSHLASPRVVSLPQECSQKPSPSRCSSFRQELVPDIVELSPWSLF